MREVSGFQDGQVGGAGILNHETHATHESKMAKLVRRTHLAPARSPRSAGGEGEASAALGDAIPLGGQPVHETFTNRVWPIQPGFPANAMPPTRVRQGETGG